MAVFGGAEGQEGGGKVVTLTLQRLPIVVRLLAWKPSFLRAIIADTPLSGLMCLEWSHLACHVEWRLLGSGASFPC